MRELFNVVSFAMPWNVQEPVWSYRAVPLWILHKGARTIDLCVYSRRRCLDNCLTQRNVADKPERRKSTRERTQLNYADLHEGNTADQQIWAKLLATKTFAKEHFPRYPGNKITREFLDKTGLKEPFIVENPEGLDMKMPPASTTVRDVADSVGRDYPVDVIGKYTSLLKACISMLNVNHRCGNTVRTARMDNGPMGRLLS